MEDPTVVRGLREMVSDRFLLAFFLMSVSEEVRWQPVE